jgi:glucose/arabinose dehydrogenase
MKKLLLLGLTLISSSLFSQTIAVQSYATGFTNALELTHPANDTRFFVVQQGGLIRIVNANGTVNATPFLNLSSLISTGSERGLLGLAFHPNYATNGLFYVNYTNTSGSTVIARYSVSANPDIANTAGTILMTISQPYSNHNGGSLKFGPDGFLYIGMGDGGNGGDPEGYAQNLSLTFPNVSTNPSRIYLGKMLRIDVDTTFGSLNYGFPATNPFVAEAGKQEIWARGLRNPWKFSFNRLTGDLWIGDVGQNNVEEINKVVTPVPNTGMNFGWRCYEGNVEYNTSGCAAASTMVSAFAQYTHSATGGCSVTGGYAYTGTTYPNFANKYFFADYCLNRISYVNTTTGVITHSPNLTGTSGIRSFGEDINGELYFTNGSTMYRLIDSSFSTSEFADAGFSMSPNPAKNTFTIKSSTTNFATSVQMHDLTGKLLLTQSLENAPENNISIASLSKGIYMVTVETTNGTSHTSKLVVE